MVIAAFSVLIAATNGQAESVAVKAAPQPDPAPWCVYTRDRVKAHRESVWAMQAELDLRRTPISRTVKIRSCPYARWVEGLWWNRKVALWPEVRHLRQVVRRLDVFLERYPMRGLGRTLEKVGRREGVSPFFIVAVAGKESTVGLAACGSNPRNVWGLGACGRAWSPPYFDTWHEAIDYFARFVQGKTTVYRGWPSARTPWDFHGYCSGCESSWASGVSRYMALMGEHDASVRYP